MSQFVFSPMVGSRVSSTAPFDYTDAMSLIQKIEYLRSQYNTLVEQGNTNAEAYNNIIAQVNQYVSDSLTGVNSATANFNTDLKQLQDLNAQTQQLFTDDQSKLDTAVNNANNALTQAEAMSQAYDAQRQADEQAMTNMNTAISGKMDKGSLVFNVADYGAKIDGATDDSAAVAAAINAAQATGVGGTVFFPPGKCAVSANTVTVPMGVLLKGAGNSDQTSAPSALYYTGTGVAVDLKNGSGIASLDVFGPGSGVTGTIGIQANISSNIRIDHAGAESFETGFNLVQIWYGDIQHPTVRKCKTGMNVNYCYNLNIFNPRFHGLLEDGNTWGTYGFAVTAKGMCNIFGGSLEYWGESLWQNAGTHVTMTGTYFENYNKGCVNGDKYASLVLIGCEVYLTGAIAWVAWDQATTGERLISFGNHFKGGATGSAIVPFAYSFPTTNGGNILRPILLGDTWLSVTNCNYRSDSNIGLTLGDPYGWTGPNGQGDDGVYGTMDWQGSILAAGMVVPYASATRFSVGGARSAAYTGGMMFDTAKGKPVWYDGSKWVDATGAAI